MLGDRIDRTQRRRRAPSVLQRGEHQAVDRIDRPARALRRRSRPSDRFPSGRLPVPALVAGKRRDIQAQRRPAARPRRRRAMARRRARRRRWRPGWTADGVLGGDLLPARRHRRSERRHDGVCEGGAGARRADRARRRGDRHRLDGGRVAAVETTRGTIETRTVVNAAGPYARADRRDGRRRRAGRSDPPPHLHRALPAPGRPRWTCPRRTSW